MIRRPTVRKALLFQHLHAHDVNRVLVRIDVCTHLDVMPLVSLQREMNPHARLDV